MEDKKRKALYLFSAFIGITTFLIILLFPKKNKKNENEINDSNINHLEGEIIKMRENLKNSASKIIDLKRDNLGLKKELNDGKIKSGKGRGKKQIEPTIIEPDTEEGQGETPEVNPSESDE